MEPPAFQDRKEGEVGWGTGSVVECMPRMKTKAETKKRKKAGAAAQLVISLPSMLWIQSQHCGESGVLWRHTPVIPAPGEMESESGSSKPLSVSYTASLKLVWITEDSISRRQKQNLTTPNPSLPSVFWATDLGALCALLHLCLSWPPLGPPSCF